MSLPSKRPAAVLVVSVLAALILAVTPGSGAAAAGPPEALARHLAWLGGADALNAVKDLTFTGTLQAAGLSGTLTTEMRRDGYSRTDYDLEVIKGAEAVTPGDAWELNASGQVEAMGAAKAAQSRRSLEIAFDLPLLGAPGWTVTPLGTEDKDGKTWDVLRLTDAADSPYDLFLDPADGSCTWVRRAEDERTAWVRLSDWRTVDGVRYPFKEETLYDVAQRNQTVTWSSIAVNTGPADSLFTRPGAGRRAAVIAGGMESTPWMPFVLHRDRYIYLHGTVNGHDTDIVLDSGAGMTVLDRAFADSLGLEGAGELPAVGTGGTTSASVVNGINIRIGELQVDNLAAAVLDLSDINRRIGRPMNVILGKEVFNNVVVDLDYPGRRIAFHDPDTYTYDGPGHSLALHPEEDGHKNVELTIGNLEPTLVSLDTGAGSGLILFKDYTDRNHLLEACSRTSEVMGAGVGGRSISKVGTLPEVTFAGYVLHDVPTGFHREEKGAFNTKRMSGNLGAGILRRFRIVFDYPHDRMTVVPEPGWDDAFPKDRSGLQAVPENGGLTVLFVAPGSPAEKAGWKEGERITAIDGKTVGQDFFETLGHWNEAPAGTRVDLTLEDGKTRTLVLADYF